MAFGPATGLEIVDALISEPALQEYHLLLLERAAACAREAALSVFSRPCRP